MQPQSTNGLLVALSPSFLSAFASAPMPLQSRRNLLPLAYLGFFEVMKKMKRPEAPLGYFPIFFPSLTIDGYVVFSDRVLAIKERRGAERWTQRRGVERSSEESKKAEQRVLLRKAEPGRIQRRDLIRPSQKHKGIS
jgi:hypothetical protein